jgi:formylglycine-generating enzyme
LTARGALALALCLGVAAGCVVPAAPVDAGGLDASGDDAPASDGAIAELDAAIDATASDASYGPCTVGSAAGECIEVARCTGDRMPVAGHCPGAADIQCCVPTTAGDCDPTLHVQPNEGVAGEAAGEGGCPDGMLPVTTFCIDRYEASLVEVLADGTTREWSPFFNPGTTRVRALSREGAVPQGYISGVQAADACDEAGKRLCTDTEWLRACQGSMERTYPYGETRMTGVCNDHRDVHPAVERFGTSESWIYSMLDDACISQLPMSVARTGAYDGCVSEPGALDMMGNLHEWTSDPAGTFRGGFYVDTVINGPGCLYRTTAHDTGHHDYSTGFRCCADL